MATGSSDSGRRKVRATPLHSDHARLGARFGMFGPAEVVNDYGIEFHEKLPLEEPLLTDLSFQGTIMVSGHDSQRFLQGMLTADISALADVGRSCYALMLMSDAHALDIVYVARTGTEEYLIMADAPAEADCAEWLSNNSRIELEGEPLFPDVQVEDQTGKLATICLMGPGAVAILEDLAGVPKPYIGDSDIARDLERGIHLDDQIANVPMLMLADPAVEGSILVFCSRPVASPLWEALVGYGELQVVGFEQYVEIRKAKGLWLKGVDGSMLYTPSEAGLEHLLRDGGGFVGARAVGS